MIFEVLTTVEIFEAGANLLMIMRRMLLLVSIIIMTLMIAMTLMIEA